MSTDEDRRSAIQAIHDSPYRCVAAVTGGGATAISDLLAVPGASRTVLEAIVPYHRASLADLLGREREWPCNVTTGVTLANVCFDRAVRIVDAAREAVGRDVLLGVGCTAALASDRPKHGRHRVYVAVRGYQQMLVAQLELTKNARTRDEEERIASDLVLHELVAAIGIDSSIELPLLETDQYERKVLPSVADARDFSGNLKNLLGE